MSNDSMSYQYSADDYPTKNPNPSKPKAPNSTSGFIPQPRQAGFSLSKTQENPQFLGSAETFYSIESANSQSARQLQSDLQIYHTLEVDTQDFQKTDFNPELHEYTLISKLRDPRYGDCIHLRDQNFDLRSSQEKANPNSIPFPNILYNERIFPYQAQAASDILRLKKRALSNCPGIMTLIDWATTRTPSEDSETGEFWTTKEIYEFPENDLKSEIEYRQKNGLFFGHEELTCLAYQLLHSFRFLNMIQANFPQNQHLQYVNGMTFDDVRPSFIGLNVKSQRFFLIDRLAEPLPILDTGADLNYLSNRNIYMAPEAFGRLG
jgi:hypothetical protein